MLIPLGNRKHVTLEKTRSYKRLIFFFFPIGSLGPVSAALFKLDLATSAKRGKTILGVEGWSRRQVFAGPGDTSSSSADHAACHPISSRLHSPVLSLGLGLVAITLYLVCFLLISWVQPANLWSKGVPWVPRGREGARTRGDRWWERHRSCLSAGQTLAKACAPRYFISKVCKSQVTRAFPL